MPPFPGAAGVRLHSAAGTWTLAGPTSAAFSVSNFGVKRVAGTVPVTSAYLEIAESGGLRRVDVALDIGAIDTGNAKRDSDLRKPALLDLDGHPMMTFTATEVTPTDDGWTVTGELTVKGNTRDILLAATALEQTDRMVRLRVTGRLDRRSYRIKAPRLLIGAHVDLEVDVQFERR